MSSSRIQAWKVFSSFLSFSSGPTWQGMCSAQGCHPAGFDIFTSLPSAPSGHACALCCLKGCLTKEHRHRKRGRRGIASQRCMAAVQGSTTAEVVATILVRGLPSVRVTSKGPIDHVFMNMPFSLFLSTNLHQGSVGSEEAVCCSPLLKARHRPSVLPGVLCATWLVHQECPPDSPHCEKPQVRRCLPESFCNLHYISNFLRQATSP